MQQRFIRIKRHIQEKLNTETWNTNMYELLDDNVELRLLKIQKELYKNVLFFQLVLVDLMLLAKAVGLFD